MLEAVNIYFDGLLQISFLTARACNVHPKLTTVVDAIARGKNTLCVRAPSIGKMG